MKISEVIATLSEIQEKFGDISVTGGAMSDDVPLRSISVTNKDGYEIWPADYCGKEVSDIDGVFLE